MKIRVILDTNLWISYLISKKLSKIDLLFERDEIVLLFSNELLDEFVEVANRPRFRKYFSPDDIEELLDLFDAFGEIVRVSAVVNTCRDSKDNFLLALSQDGRADFLVTGDRDLLDIDRFLETEIVTYADFERIVFTDQ